MRGTSHEGQTLAQTKTKARKTFRKNNTFNDCL